MENNLQTKYETKLKAVLEKLNSLNYIIDSEGNLISSIPSINNRHINMDKCEIILDIIYKYIKYNLYLKYGMKKINILPPSKDNFWSSKLIEKTSSYMINKLILFINEPNKKVGVLSKSNLLFDNIHKTCIFPLIEFSEGKNIPLIILNPKNNFDEYLNNFWKIYIKKQLKYLRNISIIVFGMSSFSLIRLLKNNKRDFEENITKIFMINSKHKKYYNILDNDLKKQFNNKCFNYVLSNEPLGAIINSNIDSLE
jgi:hypothetical protein